MKTEIQHHYYEIAGLLLELRVPEQADIDALLPTFRDFKTNDIVGKDIVSSVEITFDSLTFDLEKANLLSDISAIWGDRFSFYSLDNVYLTLVNHLDAEQGFSMLSSLDFKSAKIEIRDNDKGSSNILAWMLMVVFAQSAIWFRTVLVHASVVEKGDAAYAFLGKSGTGKSTHSRLWINHLEGFSLLNDDNPAVRILANEVRVYGTPWSGKTPCYRSENRSLKGLVRLKQGPDNVFEPKKNLEAVIAILPSCSGLRWNDELYATMADSVIDLANLVPVGELSCLPNAAAAVLCNQEINKL
ncbi:hypothetical protein ACL9RF_16950 [Sphingobacterium sp. Mn56C]|uniref:hypothetical protein n=1 Tax=Sphingobacterium sp. Mn56C TaxID=3395261 RepID=UPI003BCD31FC